MHTRLFRSIQLVPADRLKPLILLGDFGTAETALLKDIVAEFDGKCINLSPEFTQRLLSLPRRKYNDIVTACQLTNKLCDKLFPSPKPWLIDNTGTLVSPKSDQLNPIDTFKRISRQRPVVITYPARRVGNCAEYPTPGQTDHFRVPLEEFVYLELRGET